MGEIKKNGITVESPENLELINTRKEINDLKAKLKLKREIFDLIRTGENEKATKVLQKNSEILSYFIKFKQEKDDRGLSAGKVILLHLGGWIINYNPYYENEIVKDLEKLQKEIESKENRLEEYIFLKQQQEFLSLQKIDIGENKKDRKRMQEFTFILAFGVIIASLFNIFQMYDVFKKANSLHLLIISGIFIMLFVLIVIFIFANFNMNTEIKKFFVKQKGVVIGAVMCIVLSIFLLLVTPNMQLNASASTVANNSVTGFDNNINNVTILSLTVNLTINNNITNETANETQTN